MIYLMLAWISAMASLARPDLTNCILNDLFSHWAKGSALPSNDCD